jgi:hypothetical protein
MGDASRPRRHDAFGLDAQSRRVCLPAARCAQSDSNPHGLANSYSNSNSHCDGNVYADIGTETYTNTERCADAEAASYTATAAIEMAIIDL